MTELPQPQRERWQPLRLGLVELFRYDSEEFWFRDGHLLLRGNNGTGKSKVLSLTLPLLLDANLRPTRVEPDGDPGKKMAWNLLLGDAYERRSGYSWVEFGRVGDDGAAQFLTLGVGLHAVAARTHQVDAWFFIVQGPMRIGCDLWLVNAQRQVLTRERLREALGDSGQVFEQASAYRRAVDERLFGLGAQRYGALIDTLIQLRQPQLSRKPDERALSNALTESLAPLPDELLGVVADALTQLEELRQSLAHLQSLHSAVQSFDQRYRSYAGVATRRQARGLRQAQTAFDHAAAAARVAQQQFEQAQADEQAATGRQQQAAAMLAGARERLETLLADPLNGDADTLQRASADSRQRERELDTALQQARDAAAAARDEAGLLQAAQQQAATAASVLTQARDRALSLADVVGLQAALAAHPWAAAAPPDDGPCAPSLPSLAAQRREQLHLVRQRLQAVTDALGRLHPLQQALLDRQAEHEEASAALAAAEEALLEQAHEHAQAWATYLLALHELRVDADSLAAALAAWAATLQGEHPARAALHAAQTAALARVAAARAALDQRERARLDEQQALEIEADRLRAGIDPAPPAPPWRGSGTREGRRGAPLWQLLDFHPAVPAARRAGLEAALLASGLLDAWVTPAGLVLDAHWHDAAWQPRPARSGRTLAAWLVPAEQPHVGADALQALLDGVACVEEGQADEPDAEAWISLDGRFRLAGLAGAAAVSEARHIGHAARLAARVLRLAEIRSRLDELTTAQHAIDDERRVLGAREQRIADEWRHAPGEQALRGAHAAASGALQQMQQAQRREDETRTRCRQAESEWQAARQRLDADAADLHLPTDASALDAVDAALHHCAEALHALAAAVPSWRSARRQAEQQAQREQRARAAAAERQSAADERRVLAEQARSRLAALESSVGLQVQTLRQALDKARLLVRRVETMVETRGNALRTAIGLHATSKAAHENAGRRATDAADARLSEIEHLRRFAGTGLLASGLAGHDGIEIPDPAVAWTIDPALTLARRVEQALSAQAADDERWKREQAAVSEAFQTLQTSLSALGETAAAETTDFGFVVHLQWQQRTLAPQTLAAALQAELMAQQDLLSAREREVLENHLQAEIASQIQGLMRGAQRQVQAINAELKKRPTSTGVYFRLLWQPLPEGEAAPAGLHAAREKLLNTAADLWTTADRQAFGALLQRRIADERRHADSGSLLELLQRALDYRQWHQFRVERWQDGAWRKLSGPASSGERALGLTVPLFAAVASFYDDSSGAPRLMLLDEAFAGIDDAARAHCMALVREFDLDFVITSEREWACYAALPGVAICQLQRREGIDAVHVSRWSWDGRAKRPMPAPTLRIAPADVADAADREASDAA